VLSVFEAPDPEAWRLAAALASRFRVGGFSDNPAFVAELFPPDGRLDPMLFSCGLGAMKPSPAAFEAARMRIGAEPEEILFIDDSAANILEARRQGWQAILFVSTTQLTADLERQGLL
jgi:putative hydrolase of the HAD superfamily